MKVEYSSNNSGGSWWLSDSDWKALEDAGWTVDWFVIKDNEWITPDKNGRWLGALATHATREGLTLREAIAEWEFVTGQYSNELGCSCCGPPHSFTFTGDDKKTEYYSPSYPSFGDRY